MKFKPGQLAVTNKARLSVKAGTVVFITKAKEAKATPPLVACYEVSILKGPSHVVGKSAHYWEKDLELHNA
jgi:hypothetical protein|tara:strand:+ start:178 stop:390 length:213 start_codon:yes stop_codon:yes gene_type:complete